MTEKRYDTLTGDLLHIHAVITRCLDIVLHSLGKEGAGLSKESLPTTIIIRHKTEDEAI